MPALSLFCPPQPARTVQRRQRSFHLLLTSRSFQRLPDALSLTGGSAYFYTLLLRRRSVSNIFAWLCLDRRLCACSIHVHRDVHLHLFTSLYLKLYKYYLVLIRCRPPVNGSPPPQAPTNSRFRTSHIYLQNVVILQVQVNETPGQLERIPS